VAQRVRRQIVDDLDQTKLAEGAAERVEFSFRGVAYHLDLSAANAAKFEQALAPYIQAAVDAASVEPQASSGRARKRPTTRRKRSVKKASPKEDTAAIRAWANDNGYSVSPAAGYRPSSWKRFTPRSLKSRARDAHTSRDGWCVHRTVTADPTIAGR
jgi:nucleoid-associated protein Lsr2